MYKCKYCGKEFEKKQQLAGHIIWCKENPNRSGKSNFNCKPKELRKNYQYSNAIHDDLFCQYCNKPCKSMNSLRNHERFCKMNPNRQASPFVKYNKTKGDVWNKGLTANVSESVRKCASSLREYYKTHNSWLKGGVQPEETKLKIRMSTIDYIESVKGDCKPRYNKNSINYIDWLNKSMNWNLQHAENGGEIRIDGYYVDGYDKDLNIVFEYNEKRHYVDPLNNILTNKDKTRNNHIKNKLCCKFYIYNEYNNCFYEY